MVMRLGCKRNNELYRHQLERSRSLYEMFYKIVLREISYEVLIHQRALLLAGLNP